MSKIVLGTAQVGFDYGINNSRGKVPKGEVFTILDHARQAGINMLDTAFGYGESEVVLGEYLKNRRTGFQVISKLPKGRSTEIKDIPAWSLARLGIERFYGYLLHDFGSFVNDPEAWELLKKLKREGKAQKIGFSLYYPAEIDLLLAQGVKYDIVQVPYSVFDRRFEEKFSHLKEMGVEIHVRSVFLQGLVFKEPAALIGKLSKLKEKIEKLRSLSRHSAISVFGLCLGYASANAQIDKIVVGVDSLDNFIELVDFQPNNTVTSETNRELDSLKEEDESLILPFNWSSN